MNDTEQQFIADLQREDDVGLVLRGHLHIEHQLIELISVLLRLLSGVTGARSRIVPK